MAGFRARQDVNPDAVAVDEVAPGKTDADAGDGQIPTAAPDDVGSCIGARDTAYPTPMKDVNLKAMLTLKKELDINYGYSDHTLGIEIDIAAVAMGASCLEKHFTLDKSDTTIRDHALSATPNEYLEMVKNARAIERLLSIGI